MKPIKFKFRIADLILPAGSLQNRIVGNRQSTYGRTVYSVDISTMLFLAQYRFWGLVNKVSSEQPAVDGVMGLPHFSYALNPDDRSAVLFLPSCRMIRHSVFLRLLISARDWWVSMTISAVARPSAKVQVSEITDVDTTAFSTG
jgi:hypothetical protein